MTPTRQSQENLLKLALVARLLNRTSSDVVFSAAGLEGAGISLADFQNIDAFEEALGKMRRLSPAEVESRKFAQATGRAAQDTAGNSRIFLNHLEKTISNDDDATSDSDTYVIADEVLPCGSTASKLGYTVAAQGDFVSVSVSAVLAVVMPRLAESFAQRHGLSESNGTGSNVAHPDMHIGTGSAFTRPLGLQPQSCSGARNIRAATVGIGAVPPASPQVPRTFFGCPLPPDSEIALAHEVAVKGLTGLLTIHVSRHS